MRILVDTNLLVSAIARPHGAVGEALVSLIDGQDEVVVCDYCIAELFDVIRRKFPHLIPSLPDFMAYLTHGVQVVTTPLKETDGEVVLRDPKDLPVLRAAIASKADIILTGDKDLLEAGLEQPHVMRILDYQTGTPQASRC